MGKAKFNKSNLETGMRVLLKDGTLGVVMIDISGGESLIVCNDKLSVLFSGIHCDMTSSSGECDIMKVYAAPQFNELLDIVKYGDLIWERKIRSGYVRCIKTDDESFIVGKAYKVERYESEIKRHLIILDEQKTPREKWYDGSFYQFEDITKEEFKKDIESRSLVYLICTLSGNKDVLVGKIYKCKKLGTDFFALIDEDEYRWTFSLKGYRYQFNLSNEKEFNAQGGSRTAIILDGQRYTEQELKEIISGSKKQVVIVLFRSLSLIW